MGLFSFSKKPKASEAAKKTKPMKPIGVVTHYYSNLEVGIIKFTVPVSAGVAVQFKGATTDFTQTIKSIQYDHKEIEAAKKGQEVGIKVKDKVREGDEVYLSE